ncbi:MAG: ribosome biogenesis GTPase Der [Candidatus Schekmanbacteria bacterium]|nr:ribosome biogenesis GTPase Der [Candidatus Schekmanbacteria bacterium]
MNKFLVALVGRPNVGKSAIFNRLTGKRTAIVEDTPGVTRDRIYGSCTWQGKTFSVIDTGGLGSTDDKFGTLIREQTELAIQEAELILFVLDVREGILPYDEEILQQLYKGNKPLLLTVNKADNQKLAQQADSFYSLGRQVFPISAEHGLGFGDLLDEITNFVPDTETEQTDERQLKIAIVGRPNVGKSSMLNCFLGEKRALVSEQPGTTRDSVDTPYTIQGRPALLIDTAGIRRKGKVSQVLEKYSVIKALQSIERADVCLLVIDAAEGVTEQDTNLAGYIQEAGKCCIVLLNKWDLLSSEQLADKAVSDFLFMVREKLKFMGYAPLVLTSAHTGKGMRKVQELSLKVWANASERVSTAKLNQLFKTIMAKHPPPGHSGRENKIYYATQTGTRPPTFALFVSQPEGLHFSYLRYLNNQLREAFDFRGTPINLLPRQSK